MAASEKSGQLKQPFPARVVSHSWTQWTPVPTRAAVLPAEPPASLQDPGSALTYVRSAVLNACRDALRQRTRRDRRDRAAAIAWQAHPSAEAVALIGEDHRRILAGVRLLPDRQREALVCRFFLGLSEDETARAMGISKGTVKSATSRAVSALRRMLKEGKC